MFEALFGAEMPLALRFFVAFVVVLGLIGGAAYLVRRFGANALTAATARGRQPRLAVIDATPVDARRRLVLVRRDNVEHLILIGGPTDLVVEPNIVRAIPSTPQREIPAPRAAGAADSLARALPQAEPTHWPPEPALPRPPARPVAAPAAEESLAWPLQPEPAPRRAEPPRSAEAERIASLAADLSRAAGETAPRRAEARRAPPPSAPPPPAPPSVPSGEDKLPDMAQMLEAALRGQAEPTPTAAAAAKPASEPAAEPPPARAKAAADLAAAPRDAEPKPVRAAAPPAAPAKPAYDSLEQEMASLLGRPTGKT